MTAGMTGVFWLPRLAEGNSFALNAGAHAVPMGIAATSWGTLAAEWADVTATAARVMGELGVGMQSFNGVGALARLTGFTGWAGQQATMATTLASKATAQVTAYTVASLAMPSLPEIAAVNTARAAAHTTGGVLNGSSEVAEAVKKAMDIRAALVMETYEAAVTANVVTPGEFFQPPPIANGAGQADTGPAEDAMREANGNPAQMLAAAASAVAQNPQLAGVATQVANVAGTVASTGATTAGNLGANAISAMTNTTAPAPTTSMPVGMVTGGVTAATSAAATRAGGIPGSSAFGSNSGGLKLPEGWGAPPANGTPTENAALGRTEGTPVRSSSTSGNPLMGHSRSTGGDDDQEHNADDYLKSDHFSDGRYIADGVIGAEPSRPGK